MTMQRCLILIEVTLRLPNVIDHGQAAQEAKQEDAQGRSCW